MRTKSFLSIGCTIVLMSATVSAQDIRIATLATVSVAAPNVEPRDLGLKFGDSIKDVKLVDPNWLEFTFNGRKGQISALHVDVQVQFHNPNNEIVIVGIWDPKKKTNRGWVPVRFQDRKQYEVKIPSGDTYTLSVPIGEFRLYVRGVTGNFVPGEMFRVPPIKQEPIRLHEPAKA